MIDATKMLSEFAADLKFENLPQEAVDTTKMFIADYYAACAAGYKVNKRFNEAMLGILNGMGGNPEAGILFSDKKLPVENAAFMNAVYAHGADMDDGNRKAMGHVAAHVMSAVFALAETLDVTWQDVYVAINVGYEVYNRVAAAVQPGLVHRGFHSTGTAGAVACGAACAKLMGMNAEQIYNAMAIAAIQASGLIIIAESGQSCKPLNPANAAKTGIISAKLTAGGVAGPIHPLESKKGWFHAMSDEIDESMITDGLGEKFTICESYLKPYPSCRHTHCGIEGAMLIRERIIRKYGGFCSEKVQKIQVFIYKNAIQIAGQIKIPATPDDAKFSIHYSLATALLKGRYTLADLELENITDEIKQIVDKIELVEELTMENTKTGIRGSKTVVTLEDGEQFCETVSIPKGDAANPFTWEDMKDKFDSCFDGVSESKCSFNHIKNLELTEQFISISNIL